MENVFQWIFVLSRHLSIRYNSGYVESFVACLVTDMFEKYGQDRGVVYEKD